MCPVAATPKLISNPKSLEKRSKGFGELPVFTRQRRASRIGGMQTSRAMTRTLVPLSLALRGVAAAFNPPLYPCSRPFSMFGSSSSHRGGGGRSSGWRGLGAWSPGAAALFLGAGASAQLSLRGENKAECRAATTMSADTPRPWKATAVKHSTGARNDLPGGAVCQEHFFEVPLDYFDPSRGTIKVFVREVVATKQAGREDLPALLFLQGGPGFPAGRPVSADGGWVKRALETHRVFLLDQRGTGRSGAITHESLARLASPAAQ
ncbi:hypothetical protein T484DRAFT_3629751, partial [Baffinella frigidus]